MVIGEFVVDDVMTKSLSSCGDVEDCSNVVAAGAILWADDENYMRPDELWELGELPLDHTFSGFMTIPDESIDGGHADDRIMMSSP